MNEGSIITYGVCGASNSRNEVRPIAENNELFQAVVECYGESESGWFKVKRLGKGNMLYEILPDCFHKKTAPKFFKGETVFVPRKSCAANVYGIGWHFQKDEYIYVLEFNGKRSSRRYFADELKKLK